MAKQLKYWGEFAYIEGVLWRIELLEESGGIAITPTEITFPVSPLSIEWATTNKMDVVESSATTLTIVSESDRQFIDLYQVEVGAVILNVYRDGSLYWSGTLDTELYEEPYAYNNPYEVTLPFSDFAPVWRLNWDLTGYITKHDVVI